MRWIAWMNEMNCHANENKLNEIKLNEQDWNSNKTDMTWNQNESGHEMKLKWTENRNWMEWKRHEMKSKWN